MKLLRYCTHVLLTERVSLVDRLLEGRVGAGVSDLVDGGGLQVDSLVHGGDLQAVVREALLEDALLVQLALRLRLEQAGHSVGLVLLSRLRNFLDGFRIGSTAVKTQSVSLRLRKLNSVRWWRA